MSMICVVASVTSVLQVMRSNPCTGSLLNTFAHLIGFFY